MQESTYPGMILSEAMYVREIEAPPVMLKFTLRFYAVYKKATATYGILEK